MAETVSAPSKEDGVSSSANEARKPLWMLSDDELNAIQADPAESPAARQTARTILVNRAQQQHNPQAFSKPASHTIYR